MKTCAIYKSLKKNDTYLYIENKDRFERVPAALLDALGRLDFVMTLSITPQRKLAQADAAKVVQALLEQGYYLQLPSKEYIPDFGRSL